MEFLYHHKNLKPAKLEACLK